jgi:UDP-N-acetyl-D-glucosamine dehydrogenase
MDITDKLHKAISARLAIVGVCGLGYVGLPLAITIAHAGFNVKGFDIDQPKIESLNSGISYIGDVANDTLREALITKKFHATSDFGELGACDIIIICVPTPLTRNREPDLSYIEGTTATIASHLRLGQVIILESTTYPGTTSEVVKPILERGGLRSGRDFYLGFSPEREDPGNKDFQTASIPKVVSGDGPVARDIVTAFYSSVVNKVVTVSSNEIAEAVKITENIFRAVNIALVNELKIVYEAMGIDVWEVIEAAKTKPFGFMPFYPGPGLGGHCIPIDPFYLTWKSREYDLPTRFIELAGEINLSMPKYVVARLEEALDTHLSKPLSTSRILLIGIAYKKNVSDVRESPSFKLMELLEKRGARVAFHDPHVQRILPTREHAAFTGRESVLFTREAVAEYDAVVIATDHDEIDYTFLDSARLVVDTRNVCARRGLDLRHRVKA